MPLEIASYDFETADLAVFEDYAGPPTFPSGVAHEGTYCCRIAPALNGTNFGRFPGGSVVGVSSADPKSIVVRCYLRINAFPSAGGVPQDAYARVLAVGGPELGHAVLWLTGDTTNRAGVVL